MKYLIDTNVLIGVLTQRRPYERQLASLLDDYHVLTTCATVVAEIYSGMR